MAERFWALEKEFELIDFEINNVKVWQYQRFRIYLEIAQSCGMLAQAHTKKNSFFDILKVSQSLLYYSLFSNPLAGKYKKDILIFNTGRKVNVDGELIDIYTKYFIENEKLENYEIIEELIENRHFGQNSPNKKHQDYQQIRTFILSSISRFKISKKQLGFIQTVNQKINKEFNIQLKLEKLLRNAYLNFKNDYDFYYRLLKKRQPSKVFMVCSYTYKKSLVAAAKKLGVETIELQHGTIDKYHMGYNYPRHKKVDYFPDKLYVFGQYWKDVLRLPINDKNIEVKGFPYFNKQYDKFKSIKKIPKQITILSQGTIGLKMSRMFVENIDEFKQYDVNYKLHPGEYSRWQKDYRELKEAGERPNIEIIDHNKENLYAYLQRSEIVIGVYSTAVYEALAFNCKVILINLPGIEYMAELVAKKLVSLANNFDEVKQQLESTKTNSFPTDYFFKQK